VESLAISPGDQLVFATDGIESDFVADLAREGSPQEKAEYMLRRHHRGNDDGLVLVMSFLGVTR
jgi:hypothetical protein